MSSSTYVPASADDIRYVPRKDKFNFLVEQRKGPDFPFYNGLPTLLSPLQWLAVVSAVFIGYLIEQVIPFIGPAALIWIPLWVLGKVAGPSAWRSLFHKVRIRDFFYMVLFAFLSFVGAMILGIIVDHFTTENANPVAMEAAQLSGWKLALFALTMFMQFVGEELMYILPFLAVLSVLHARFGFSRKAAILCAWFVSCMLFGAAHLPIYQWNLLQAFVVIGCSHLIGAMVYIRTKNVWVSTGSHFIYDGSLFALSMFLGP